MLKERLEVQDRVVIYKATEQQFLHGTDNDDIEDVLLAHFIARTGKRVGRLEINSWKGSLGGKYLAKNAAPRTAYETKLVGHSGGHCGLDGGSAMQPTAYELG